MSAPDEITPEQLCERLNAYDGGKGWRERCDWASVKGFVESYVHGLPDGIYNRSYSCLTVADARAIIAGIDATEELAALSRRLNTPIANLRDVARVDIENATLRAKLAALTTREGSTDTSAICVGPGPDNYGEGYLDSTPQASPTEAVGPSDLAAIESTIAVAREISGQALSDGPYKEILYQVTERCATLLVEVRRLKDQLQIVARFREEDCVTAHRAQTRCVELEAELAALRAERDVLAGALKEELEKWQTTPAPVGSWAWALEQMKAGKRVWYEAPASDEWDRSYVRLIPHRVLGGSDDAVFINAWGSLWFPKLSEIERTDWQLAETQE